MIKSLFMRDVSLAFRHGGGAFAGIIFYILVFTLFAFALGPEELSVAAPGVLCVTLLLSIIISLPYLFERDQEDGSLEILLAHPVSAEWLVAAKLGAYWVSHALPLVALAPFLAFFAGMPQADIGQFSVRLLLASFALTATGALGAALTLQQRRGVLSRALILLPFYIPALIFTVSEIHQAFPAWLLAGWTLLIWPVSCWVSGLLLRIAQE